MSDITIPLNSAQLNALLVALKAISDQLVILNANLEKQKTVYVKVQP
jgi:hypothetical protein